MAGLTNSNYSSDFQGVIALEPLGRPVSENCTRMVFIFSAQMISREHVQNTCLR